MSQKIKIAINAQILQSSGAGGTESVLISLINALGKLESDDEEYIIVGPWQNPYWLKPYIGKNQRIVPGPGPSTSLTRKMLRQLKKLVPVHLFTSQNQWAQVPISDGFFESLGCDVVHFPNQNYVICGIPSIFNPHDLQHLHLPQFFPAPVIASRDVFYSVGCHFSNTVVVASQWVKNDVIKNYGIDADKIQVIPFAPTTLTYEEPTKEKMEMVKEKFGLKLPFIFYPAMTWPHKNHLRLIEAIALLRTRDNVKINLVCTGYQNFFWPKIERRIAELNLEDQVKFIGLVSPIELRLVYRLSQLVVIPTLFEAASGPLNEAWAENVPAACSSVTSLPDQAKDAALIFDPYSVESIADAILKMVSDPELREKYITKGAKRLQDFSWERTAKAYRAVYRRAAGLKLNEEDTRLLQWDWMISP